jgi:DNA-binding transcriptional ArsR family regulator/protein-L-isoaspartate O-methyltransferase
MRRTHRSNRLRMPAATAYESFLNATRAVADPLRADILRALSRDSFGVLELAHIFDVTQPALSHHLKILSRAGLVATRRDGNGIYYRRAQPRPGALHDYVAHLYTTLDTFAVDDKLKRRMGDVHAGRAQRSRKFFADHAREFESQRELICVPETYLPALRESIDAAPCARRRALDVGPGGGETLSLLAEHFDAVLGIDNSPEILERTRAAIGKPRSGKITLRLKDFESLKSPRQDLVLFAMVLHHAASPRRFFEHAQMLLNDGGVLIVVELVAHDQEWAKTACGDLWLGFDPTELDEWAADAGLASHSNQYLAQRNGFRIQIRTYQKGVPQ